MIAVLLLLVSLTTPIDVRPLTPAQICSTKWGTDARHVTTAMKRQVFAAAHVPWTDRRFYIVDHRVPRELAGADVLANLWLQTIVDAHTKDLDENRLHRAVCASPPTITLLDAQTRMRHWR